MSEPLLADQLQTLAHAIDQAVNDVSIIGGKDYRVGFVLVVFKQTPDRVGEAMYTSNTRHGAVPAMLAAIAKKLVLNTDDVAGHG